MKTINHLSLSLLLMQKPNRDSAIKELMSQAWGILKPIMSRHGIKHDDRTDFDRVITFCIEVGKDVRATPAQVKAARIMQLCVHFVEGHIDREMLVGFILTELPFIDLIQSARRKENPKTQQIRKRHAALKAEGAHDPTSQVAIEFGLGTRRIRQILEG